MQREVFVGKVQGKKRKRRREGRGGGRRKGKLFWEIDDERGKRQ